jgi:DNA-binding LacI/PurR family transcriptional regulator
LRGQPGISIDIRRRVLTAARESGYTLPGGASFDDSVFEKKGVICLDIPSVDEWHRRLIEVIRRRGLCVPEDIGVAGYDDVAPPLAPDIRLTTVHLPLAEMGAAAVSRLHWRLNNPDGEPPLHWLVEARIVEGNSVRAR